MSTEVRIPSLGAGMAEGTITEWVVADGGEVKQGDILYVLESEKTSQEIEAPASGKLQIIGQVGDTFPVGDLVAKIE